MKPLRRNRAAFRGIPRRSFVRSVGVGALALPFLRRLQGNAQELGPPQRLLVLFSPNGTIRDEWVTGGGETDFRLGRILEPLSDFREQLLIPQGLYQSRDSPGDDHMQGTGRTLTGAQLLTKDTGGGISLDQAVANHIAADLPFPSLELGGNVGRNAGIFSRISYRGAGDPLPPETDPQRAFERVFAEGALPSGNEEEDAARAAQRMSRRQSVLDSVAADFASLRSRVGREYRQDLEIELDLVRDLEQRLMDEPAAAGCAAPDLSLRDGDDLERKIARHMDIAVAAFACDLTRVVTIQATNAVSDQTYPWIGVSGQHHAMSHNSGRHRDDLIEIDRWYATQVASVLERLAAVPEAGGTMLDNTLVMWVNELANGDNHKRDDMPILLAGNTHGRFRMGRYLRFDRYHNDLLLTIARVFGLDVETFGERDQNRGELGELLV